MKTIRQKHSAAFTLVEIMIVVAIVALLAAIAIPNLLKASAKSQATSCINNLREIDTAIQVFSVEAGKHIGDTITWPDDLSPYIKLNTHGAIPSCPAGGDYVVGLVGTNPSVTCSLSTLNPPHAQQ